MYASEYIWNNIKHDKTVGVINKDEQTGLMEIAEPVGVVCGSHQQQTQRQQLF